MSLSLSKHAWLPDGYDERPLLPAVLEWINLVSNCSVSGAADRASGGGDIAGWFEGPFAVVEPAVPHRDKRRRADSDGKTDGQLRCWRTTTTPAHNLVVVGHGRHSVIT